MPSVAKTIKSIRGKKEIPVIFKRVTVDNSNSVRDRFLKVWEGVNSEKAGSKRFQSVSEDDLLNLPENKLIPKMVKSDSLIDLTVDTFSTLVGLEHELTAETTRTERIIQELLQMLDEKQSPLSLHVSHIASSLICYGNAVIEAEFEDGNPANLFVVNPTAFEWKLSDRWRLGQYDADRQWQEIESPNVRWESLNPLPGERIGRSPIITAIPNRLKDEKLLATWAKLIDSQAFIKRYIEIKVTRMKELNYTDAQIEAAVKKAETDIAGWRNLQPNEIPTATDVVGWNELSGARTGSGAGLVDTSNRVYDRGSLRGAKLSPFIAGSNEFTAETSSGSQVRLYSVRIASGQEIVKSLIEWSVRRFIRSRGNSGDPIFTTRHFDAEERQIEAEAFHSMILGIKDAVEAGMTLIQAINLFEATTGTTIDAEVKADIERTLSQSTGENDD